MAFTSETGTKAGKKSKRGQDTQLKEIREVFTTLLENNQSNIQTWLDEAAKEDPARALELLLKISSFVVPKLRTIDLNTSISIESKRNSISDLFPITDEITGKNEPVRIVFTNKTSLIND